MKKVEILKKEDIQKLYFNERKSLKDTALNLECPVSYLRKCMKMHELPIRSNLESLQGHKGKKKKTIAIKKDDLIKKYEIQKMSLSAIAREFGVTHYLIERILKDYGIRIRNHDEAAQMVSWVQILKNNPKHELNRIPWYSLQKREREIIDEAIKQKQKHIQTDIDLTSFGYVSHINKRDKKEWTSPESYTNQKKQKRIRWRENSEVRKNTYERCKTWNEANRERTKEWRRKWEKTEIGKASLAKSRHKRRSGGSIPLNKELNDVPSDWHHVAPSLPFCISIPREIHQSVGGNSKQHFTKVNELAGYPEFNCGEKEDIEYYIELNYPEQFRQYWFGNY